MERGEISNRVIKLNLGCGGRPLPGYVNVDADTLEQLKQEDMTIGEAFRNARNAYLPEDASWEVWWSPPLVYTGITALDEQYQNNLAKRTAATSGLDPQLDNKFQSFFEYHIFGDPAFVPYVPVT
jgi:hypothetical protein